MKKKKDDNIRTIKFYMDKQYHKKKCYKDTIQFLTECNIVENKLLEYYWNHFDNVLNATNNKDFYNNRIAMPKPRLKFHHYMNLLFQVYENLTSIKSNIINNKIYFNFEDKEKQRTYNYCKGFCFDWDRLPKYITKQMKEYKRNKDEESISYYKFLCLVNNYVDNGNIFNKLKSDIENRFYEEKSKISCPQKHEMQIRVSTFHTLDIDKSNPNKWVFTLDSNKLIGGSEKRGKFDTIRIPVKVSDYHREKLEGHELASTFNIKLNSYGRIEIGGFYELGEVECNHVAQAINKEKSYTGIDIGLNKFITTSDGEIIEQNPKIVKLLEKVVNKQANRQTLEEHLKVKYNDTEFKLSDKLYKKIQNKLTRFVTCDNRYKLKVFVMSCAEINTEIVMEDLHIHETKTNNRKVNNMMKRLHIQRIKDDIIRYAKELGIKVHLVNPAFTSQQCPICGCIDKKNRVTQEQFKCIECGYEINADYNASNNIKNRFINKQSFLGLRYFEVKDKLKIKALSINI